MAKCPSGEANCLSIHIRGYSTKPPDSAATRMCQYVGSWAQVPTFCVAPFRAILTALRKGVSLHAYVIDWLDHAEVGSEQAWSNIGEIDADAPLVRTVGFVVKETPQAYVIAHTTDNEECSSPFILLKATVVSMKKIRLPAKKRAGTVPAKT